MDYSDHLEKMDGELTERLSDTVTLVPAAGQSKDLPGFADFGERIAEFQGGSAAQISDAFLEIGVDVIGRLPAKTDRFILPDGNTYQPQAWPLNEDATFYRVSLKKTANG